MGLSIGRSVKAWPLPTAVHGVLCAVLLSVLAPHGVRAQNAVNTDAVDTSAGEAASAAARDEFERLQRAREQLDAAPEETVTFADILRNPDDIALNFAYAKQQVAQGRLKAAATTLERILLIEPGLHEVRLFYALVLIRLDSLESAERELLALQQLDMEPSLREELDGLLARIRESRERFRVSLLTGVGGGYQWNVNSIPANRRLRFGGASVLVDDDSDRVGDFNFTAFSRFDASYDLGYQARHELIGSVTHYLGDQVNQDQQDIWSYTVDGGVRLRFPDLTITPRAYYTVLWLSHQRYHDNVGAELAGTYQLPPDMAISAGASYTFERYNPISEARTQLQDEGWRLDGFLGLDLDLDASNRISFQYDIRAKYGTFNYEHHWEHSIAGTYLHLFEGGVFTSGTATLGQRRDFRPDPSTDPGTTRHDISVELQARVGAPLSLAFGEDEISTGLRRHLDRTIVSATVSAERSMSNVANSQLWRRGADVLITRKWDF